MSRLGVNSMVQDFRIEKFLGKGSYGAVYRVKRQTDGRTYAMKQINTQKMTQKEREDAVNEIRILASVESQYIIKFNEAFVDNMNLYIITEYAGKGDMFQRLRRLAQKRQMMPEDQAWVFFIQLCLGIKALHDNNILHRDLKSANVFLSETNCIKIGDLGVAKLLAATRAMAKTQIGTPYYVSPELWKNKPYNAKSDIWALGCLFYEMVVGKPPFDSTDMRGLARKVMRGVYSPITSKYSKDLHEVIGQLLNVNPSARPSVNQILKMPQVASRMNLLPVNGGGAANEPGNNQQDLVGTIHVPRKLRDLTKALPTPRYEDEVSPKPPQDQRLPNLPSAAPAPQPQSQPQTQPQKQAAPSNVNRSPPGDPSPENPVSDAAFKPHKPHPPNGYYAKPPSRGGSRGGSRGYGSEASSARSYQVPRSARSRGGPAYPGSSRYSQHGAQSGANYGPYHRRQPAGAPSRGGSKYTSGSSRSGYYAGSQYARAGYAGHYDNRQPAGGQPGGGGGGGGHGEWERAIEARLARVLGPSYSKRQSSRGYSAHGVH